MQLMLKAHLKQVSPMNAVILKALCPKGEVTRGKQVVRVLGGGEGGLQCGVYFQQACGQLVCSALTVPASV